MTVQFDHPFRYSFTTCFKERHIIRLLQPRPGHSILEVGCGSAYFYSVLKRYFPNDAVSYSGIDIEDNALRCARQLYGSDVRLLKGDVTSLPFPDSNFDDVLYLDVIEHVADDKKSLKEIHRTLKKDGRLILSTPNLGALLTDTFFCNYLHDEGGMLNQRHGYTISELVSLLHDTGFKVEQIRYSNVFLSEILITITKLGFRLKKSSYATQASVFEVSKSPLFLFHKYIFFPLGYVLCRLEEMLLGTFLKGHCAIILATKTGT